MTEKETKKPTNPVTRIAGRVVTFCRRLFIFKKSLIPRGSTWEDIKLYVSPEVNSYLEMRHVQEDQLKQVIFHAETSGDKLYQPKANRYLGKLKIGKATFYVDYSYGDGNFIVKYGYAHRSELIG